MMVEVMQSNMRRRLQRKQTYHIINTIYNDIRLHHNIWTIPQHLTVRYSNSPLINMLHFKFLHFPLDALPHFLSSLLRQTHGGEFIRTVIPRHLDASL